MLLSTFVIDSLRALTIQERLSRLKAAFEAFTDTAPASVPLLRSYVELLRRDLPLEASREFSGFAVRLRVRSKERASS